jgi:negative regulator of flagellin synthesis FlgM
LASKLKLSHELPILSLHSPDKWLPSIEREKVMTDAISQYGRQAPLDNPSRAALDSKIAADAKSPVDASAAKQAVPVADNKPTVAKPGPDMLILSNVAKKVMAEPSFDRAKVDAIKQAIQDGQYPLDARRIAESFMAIEKMIYG